MKKFFFVGIVFIIFLGSAHAHHGTAGQFDASRIIELNGVISDFAFVNPHSYVYVDVKDEYGNVATWNCELRASSVMKRSGWKEEMFSSGTTVDIIGVASRRDPNGCYVETIAFNGGPAYERYAQIPKKQNRFNVRRPSVTPWGVPYIGGDWAAEQRLVGSISGPNAMTSSGRPKGQPGIRMGSIQLTGAGEAALSEANAMIANGVKSRLDCSPRDFFSDWTFDQASNSIIQEEDKITLRYGFMDTVRTIYLDMDEHPRNVKPSWAGHSIGRWDDDVLIVDTQGFTEAFSSRGIRSSQFHTIERFKLDTKAGSLTRTYIAEDPLYWENKLTGEDVVFLSDYPWEPYDCDDRTVE